MSNLKERHQLFKPRDPALGAARLLSLPLRLDESSAAVEN
jgi:hypothetical protein